MLSAIVANATTLAVPLELNRTARDAALYQEDDDDEDEAQWSAPEEKADDDDDDDNVTHTGNARAKRPRNSQIINLSGPDSDSDDDVTYSNFSFSFFGIRICSIRGDVGSKGL